MDGSMDGWIGVCSQEIRVLKHTLLADMYTNEYNFKKGTFKLVILKSADSYHSFDVNLFLFYSQFESVLGRV
jgi:hypothetical protein